MDNPSRLSSNKRLDLVTDLYLDEHPLESKIDIFQRSRYKAQLYYGSSKKHPIDVIRIHQIGIEVVNEILSDKWLLFFNRIFKNPRLIKLSEEFSEKFIKRFDERIAEEIKNKYGI